MGNLWLKIRGWTKILVVALALLYVIFFVANNSSERVHVWFWINVRPEPTVLLLALYAFLAGVLVAVLTRTTFRTIKQFKDMQERQRTAKVEKKVAEMEQKAA